MSTQSLASPNLNTLYTKNIPWAYCYTQTGGPVNRNGYLRVTAMNNLCLQEYIVYSTNEYYIRQRLADGTWMPWAQK